jgi:hypothetical protein
VSPAIAFAAITAGTAASAEAYFRRIHEFMLWKMLPAIFVSIACFLDLFTRAESTASTIGVSRTSAKTAIILSLFFVTHTITEMQRLQESGCAIASSSDISSRQRWLILSVLIPHSVLAANAEAT